MNVVVTGGAGLIGSAFVTALEERGDCVLIADIDVESGRNIADRKDHENIRFEKCDVTDPREVDTALAAARDRFGSVDACVHAAYPHTPEWGTPFEELKKEHLNKNIGLQMGSAIMVSQRAISIFRKQNHGHLVHISSIQGIRAPKFDHYEGLDMHSPIEYSAIKSGIIAITKYLAKYLSGTSIRVNCISPGGVKNNQPKAFQKRYRKDCTSKGMVDPNDLSGALMFLLSESSSCINGQNIVVDDGWSL
jgi:NAD(P)-dependent dehydrogenase (short-subunit alcohol dehydrogenase family)